SGLAHHVLGRHLQVAGLLHLVCVGNEERAFPSPTRREQEDSSHSGQDCCPRAIRVSSPKPPDCSLAGGYGPGDLRSAGDFVPARISFSCTTASHSLHHLSCTILESRGWRAYNESDRQPAGCRYCEATRYASPKVSRVAFLLCLNNRFVVPV